jgi:hypothetical protein
LNIIKRAALSIAKKKFCREAIQNRADLKSISRKPSTKVIVGIILIAFSYVIGMPAVVAFGVVAAWLKEPLVAVVGGPLIYAISTIIFIVGIKLAGKKYFVDLLRWTVRVILEKILGADVCQVTGGASGGEYIKGQKF